MTTRILRICLALCLTIILFIVAGAWNVFHHPLQIKINPTSVQQRLNQHLPLDGGGVSLFYKIESVLLDWENENININAWITVDEGGNKGIARLKSKGKLVYEKGAFRIALSNTARVMMIMNQQDRIETLLRDQALAQLRNEMTRFSVERIDVGQVPIQLILADIGSIKSVGENVVVRLDPIPKNVERILAAICSLIIICILLILWPRKHKKIDRLQSQVIRIP